MAPPRCPTRSAAGPECNAVVALRQSVPAPHLDVAQPVLGLPLELDLLHLDADDCTEPLAQKLARQGGRLILEQAAGARLRRGARGGVCVRRCLW